MALFKAILGELSGKLGGSVFSHNRGGTYTRVWKIPTNPNTPAQQKVRTAMAYLVVAWLEELSDDDRDKWDTYAENVPMTNRLGETIYLTGQNHFIRSNVPRKVNFGTIIKPGPLIYNLGAFGATSIMPISPLDIFFFFDDSEDWAQEPGSWCILQVGAPQNSTIHFFKGPFITYATFEGAVGNLPESPRPESVPDPFISGQKIFIRSRVSRADGRLSTAQIVSEIAI